MATHNQAGTAAENKVAEYLKRSGYKIVAQNWKTKWCEVDIIAQKDDCLFFVEVKYRGSAEQGSGYDYITPKKLHKMYLAARSWVEIKGWNGEYTLSAAEVSGSGYQINFLESL